MKKIVLYSFTLASVILAFIAIFYIYKPFYNTFINYNRTAGDSLMHLANLMAIQKDHAFPILAWKTEYAGYPLIEGYPWLHYYLIQPFLSFFRTPGIAMDQYMSIFLLIYYLTSFVLLFYVSKNPFLALLFTSILIYGADSQFPLTINAFMTFTSSLFFLPLILLITIIAREKGSIKLLILASLILSIVFYAHGSMTGIVIVPLVIPFVILDKNGKVSKDSIRKTVIFFSLFILFSSIQIYQFFSYNAQGYLRGVNPFPLRDIPERLKGILSWLNPVLLPVLLIFLPLYVISIKKHFSKVLPYLLSLLLLGINFTLMIFNITSMNLILLAERSLWGISLSFLLLFSKVLGELTSSKYKKLISYIFSASFLAFYLYLVLIAKYPHLVPDVLRERDPYMYLSNCVGCDISKTIAKSSKSQFSNKYDEFFTYPIPEWAKSFDNFRTDGVNWELYSSWNIWSSNPRYKGRFPAAKGLPLDWSGLVTAAEFGNLGEAGTADHSQWAINQTLFFFDWYGIKHLEICEQSWWPDYLKNGPLISDSVKIFDTLFTSIDDKYISPIYYPTNAKIMAVISPKIQYDAFIRTLSYSEITSEKLVPIYLGQNLGALNKNNLKMFDVVFLYGYKERLLPNFIWDELASYANNGGNLIIETGQRVNQSENSTLPSVFPINKTKIEVVSKSWVMQASENNLTKNINPSDFAPFKTKYLPYALSEVNSADVKSWAKPVLSKDGNILMVYGELGKGKVVWSGINLPFHAIDNRNVSETIIFSNILNWFFPEFKEPITNFKVSHPKPEDIIVISSQGKGVLLKENYNPGWIATLNGQKTKIYKAGLFEMYIPFKSDGINKVELKYYGNPLHWLLFFIFLFSLIGVLIYLIFTKNVLVWVRKLIKLKSDAEEVKY